MILEYLDWDSGFFEMDVYKCILNNKTNVDISKCKKGLTYLFSEDRILNLETSLVDQKVTFTKEVSLSKQTKDELIISYPKNQRISEEILQLSYQSGQYSRFFIDSNITQAKFLKLYKLWIVNSVNRKYADEVYTYKFNGKDIGLITVSKKQNTCIIGLLSVDKEYREQKIGSKLMDAAEKWALSQGCHTILVQTQKDNKAACSFYKKKDYKVLNQEFIYHIWK